MFKTIVACLAFVPIVLSAQLNLRSEVFPRQSTCSANKKVCGSGCIPQTANCCDTYYCPASRDCDGKGGCSCTSTEKSCGDGCIPSSGVCCANGQYCDAGEFCAPVEGYCCRNVRYSPCYPVIRTMLICVQGEDPATCAIRQSFTLPAATATTTSAEVVSPPIQPTTNLSSIATSVTVTTTSSIVEFTGAASKRDSVAGTILGALGLLAAL